MSEYGKRGTAPCGHPGVYIIGQFVQCLGGCELVADDFPSIEHCPKCGSSDIDEEYLLDPMFLVFNPNTIAYDRRCWSCGGLWVKRH